MESVGQKFRYDSVSNSCLGSLNWVQSELTETVVIQKLDKAGGSNSKVAQSHLNKVGVGHWLTIIDSFHVGLSMGHQSVPKP